LMGSASEGRGGARRGSPISADGRNHISPSSVSNDRWYLRTASSSSSVSSTSADSAALLPPSTSDRYGAYRQPSKSPCASCRQLADCGANQNTSVRARDLPTLRDTRSWGSSPAPSRRIVPPAGNQHSSNCRPHNAHRLHAVSDHPVWRRSNSEAVNDDSKGGERFRGGNLRPDDAPLVQWSTPRNRST